MATTSDVVKRLIVEMYVGGMSQRDMEYSLESALGQFVLSKSTVSELTDTWSQEYEAFRTRDLSGEPVAYLFMIRCMNRYAGGETRPVCCVSGRFVRMGAKFCSVSPPPIVRVTRVAWKCVRIGQAGDANTGDHYHGWRAGPDQSD